MFWIIRDPDDLLRGLGSGTLLLPENAVGCPMDERDFVAVDSTELARRMWPVMAGRADWVYQQQQQLAGLLVGELRNLGVVGGVRECRSDWLSYAPIQWVCYGERARACVRTHLPHTYRSTGK